MSETPKIRPLLRSDRVLVTGLFKKAIEELRDESTKNLISSKKTKTNKKAKTPDEEEWGKAIVDIAVGIIDSGLKLFDEDFGAWFADLLGVSLEEFNKMPLNVEADVINQIRTAPEAIDFFTLCFQRAKMTEWLETPLRMLKERFGSIFESEKENLENSPT